MTEDTNHKRYHIDLVLDGWSSFVEVAETAEEAEASALNRLTALGINSKVIIHLDVYEDD